MVPFCPLSSLSSSTVSLANSVSNDANGVVPGSGGGGKYKTASRSNSRGLYDTGGGNNGYSTFPRYASSSAVQFRFPHFVKVVTWHTISQLSVRL